MLDSPESAQLGRQVQDTGLVLGGSGRLSAGDKNTSGLPHLPLGSMQMKAPEKRNT